MAIGKSKLHELLNRSRELDDAVAWLRTFTPQTRKELAELIRNDQLARKNEDATGDYIGFYSPVTEQIDPSKEAGTPYTLKDTGEFYRSIYVQVFQRSIRFDADDEKMRDQSWYTEQIVALSDENFKKLIKKIKEAYIKEAKRVLFGTR